MMWMIPNPLCLPTSTPEMLKPCNWKKCHNLVTIDDSNRTAPCYCEEHLSLYYSENRKRYPRNKYGPLWQRISKSHLYRNKYCQCDDTNCLVCYGQHKSAGTVLAS